MSTARDATGGDGGDPTVRDLSKLAGEFEARLPGVPVPHPRSRHLRTGSPDILAMMMFQPDYIHRLIELGDEDTEARLDDVAELLGIDASTGAPPSSSARAG
jgi:hypothetical protein